MKHDASDKPPPPLPEGTMTDSSAELGLGPSGEPRLPARDGSRYELLGEHARGGLGRILRARDRDLGRVVALKELLDANPVHEARFAREIKLTASLEHPGIVPIHDAGSSSLSGRSFYTMKLVGGASLKDVVGRAASLDERLALTPQILAVAEAVAYAHSRGIVHRDLKPANVVVGEYGETIVIDWGLAKAIGEPDDPRFAASAEGEHVTVAGTVLGTPAFMAPEQARGEAVDARADVYAIGAMAYYVLAGRQPYDGASSDEVLRRVLREAPPPLRRREPGVPADLAAIVDKAMARRPEDRYPSARELTADLRSYQTGRLVQAREYAWWELALRLLRRYWLVASLTLAFLVVGATGLAVALRRETALRHTAESAQGRAEQQSLALLEQQARRELDAGRPRRASVYLAAALRRAPDSLALRWLISQALPAQAAHLRALAGHEKDVVCVDFSPDGKRIATGSTDRTVRIWDAATGQELQRLTGGERGSEDVKWSPDGTVLASAHGRGLQLWRTSDWQVIASLEGAVYRLAFSPDSRTLWAGGMRGDLVLVDVATGAPRALSPSHLDRVSALWLDPHGPRAITGDWEGQVFVWDTRTGERVGQLRDHKSNLELIVASPDGRVVASGDEQGALHLRDGQTLEVLHSIYLPRQSHATEAWFVGDGRTLLTTSADGTVRIFHASSGELLATIDATAGGKLFDASVSPDGTRLATGALRQVDLWALDRGPPYRVLDGSGQRDKAAYHPGVLSADGSTLIATRLSESRPAHLHVWDTASGRLTGDFEVPGRPYSLAISRDGRVGYVSNTNTGEVNVYDLPAGTLRFTTPPSGKRVYGLSLDPEERTLATASGDLTVRLYDAQTGAPGLVVTFDRRPTEVGFDPVRPRLAVCDEDGTIHLVDRRSGAIERKWSAHATWTEDVQFSRDGRRLLSVGRQDHTDKIWDLERPEAPPVLLVGHQDNTMFASFSPDGELVASVAVDETARIWDARTGAMLRVLTGPTYTAAFSPDGRTLFTTGDKDFAVAWDLSIDARPGSLLADEVERTSPWTLENGRLVERTAASPAR